MSLNESVKCSVNMPEGDLARYVIAATKEIFSTMVMMDLSDDYPLKEPVTRLRCSITGMIGLAGTYTGILSRRKLSF